MTSAEASAVWRRVFASMDIWEQDVGTGSARPAFATAWGEATRTVPLAEPWTFHEREACWKAWLEAGKPLTDERAATLMRQAQSRAKDGLFGDLFANALNQIRDRKKPDRDPGEEG